MAVECLAHPDDDRIEDLGVMDRQVREALAVEPDLGEAEAVDQAAVAEAAHLGRRAEAGDEQPAERALLRRAIAEREHAGPEQRLLGRTEQTATTADKSFS